MSFLDLLEETPVEAGTTTGGMASSPPETVAVVVPAPAGLSSRRSEAELAQEGLRQIEDSLYEQSSEILSDAFRAPELDGEGQMPEAWLEKYGPDRVEKMTRVARHASLPSKEAPVYLQMAQKTQAAISKARAAAGTGPKVLNMTLVQMPGANVVFPEKELKGTK
jgi:hypothetical protein